MTLEKSLQIKEVITQLVACLSIFQRKLQIDCNRSKQKQALDANPKAIQQINFKGHLKQAGNKTFFIITIKETILAFSQGKGKVLQTCSASLFGININKTKYHRANVKLSNLQLNKLKSATKKQVM